MQEHSIRQQRLVNVVLSLLMKAPVLKQDNCGFGSKEKMEELMKLSSCSPVHSSVLIPFNSLLSRFLIAFRKKSQDL